LAKRNSEKRRIEHEAIKLFIQLFNEQENNKLRLMYQRERPDAVLEYTATRSKLGVEITHLFYDACEAKQLFGRSDQEDCDGPKSFDVMLAELNNRIHRKETIFTQVQMNYPISLLIRNASPRYGRSSFIEHLERISLSRHIFQDIWLLTHDHDSNWHLMRLPDGREDVGNL